MIITIFIMIEYGHSKAVTGKHKDYLKQWKLRQGISSKKTFYNVMRNTAKLYLPSITSRCISGEYLDGVIMKKFFSIDYDSVVYCDHFSINVTVELLYFELISILSDQAPDYCLGFDEYTLPDKKWLVTVMYTLNPNAEFFKKHFNMPEISEQEELLIKGEIIPDESFKCAKHPAYAQHVFNKMKKRQIKKELYKKHSEKITEKYKNLTEDRYNRLDIPIKTKESLYIGSDEEPNYKMEESGEEESTNDQTKLLMDANSVRSANSFRRPMQME